MKKIFIVCISVFVLLLAPSCDSYLNVNNNVDSPDWVEPNLKLAPILNGLAANYWDMRMVGPMCQYFNGTGTVPAAYGTQMSAVSGSDYAEVWKMVYFVWGKNLEEMISDGKQLKQPLYAGIGLALKAYGWYELTSLHGDAPCKQFLDPGRTVFEYDSQEYILEQSRTWAREAIKILSATDNATYPSSLPSTDLMYQGNRNQWLKFAYGVLAKNYLLISAKNPAYLDSAIVNVDKSMTSYSDDATVRLETSTLSANNNFFGVLRGNLAFTYVYSDYMVDILTGTVKKYDPNTGNTSASNGVTTLMDKMYVTDTLTMDPRAVCYFGTTTSMPDDLSKIDRKTYKYTGTRPGQAPQVSLWGTTSAAATSVAALGTGRWLFRDNAPYIIMTYSELQFIKAEAQYRKGLKSDALTTFRNAVAASMKTTANYIVQGVPVKNTSGVQTSVIGDKISQAVFNSLSSTYLNSKFVGGLAEADFELAHIMMQKYVALYPWGLDTWNDIRRYHYDLKLGASNIPETGTSWISNRVYHKLDTDPTRVYKGFYLYPADVTNRRGTFVADNEGSPSYRLRPRFNSEYMWNIKSLEALKPISGTSVKYNTSMVWFCLP